jgi:hypothetical protein
MKLGFYHGIRALLVISFIAGSACAKPTVDTDALAIEKTIRAQMAAFSKDDADAAFALATPSIRQLFHNSPSSFLDSVKSAYQPVYRPGDVEFLSLKRDAGHFVQPVKISMGDGKVYIAYYDMQRQPDKSWRINGCQLAVTDDVAT